MNFQMNTPGMKFDSMKVEAKQPDGVPWDTFKASVSAAGLEILSENREAGTIEILYVKNEGTSNG